MSHSILPHYITPLLLGERLTVESEQEFAFAIIGYGKGPNQDRSDACEIVLCQRHDPNLPTNVRTEDL